MAAKKVSKTERYRETFRELGVDVSPADFRAYVEKHFGIKDVPDSAFYAVRKEFQAGSAAPTPARKAEAVNGGSPARVAQPTPKAAGGVPVEQLPDLLAELRTLLGRFGGDKATLIKIIAAL